MVSRTALFALVLLPLACQQPSQPAQLTPEEEARIAAEVDATVRAYADAVRSLDVDGMLAFWADVDGFAMAGDGTLLVGYEPWADHIRQFVESTAEARHFELRNPQVYVLAQDAVSYSCEFEWRTTSKEGETTNASGSWIYVFKRFPEGWQVVHSAGTHIYS